MIKVFHHYISAVFLILFGIEYCVFFASMYFGSEFRFLLAESWYSEGYIVSASWIFATTLSFCLVGIGLYRRNLGHNEYELLSRTAVGFAGAIFTFACIYYFFSQFLIARSVLAFALILAFLGMLICRFIFIKIVGKNAFKKKVLVIGCGNNANKMLQSKSRLYWP